MFYRLHHECSLAPRSTGSVQNPWVISGEQRWVSSRKRRRCGVRAARVDSLLCRRQRSRVPRVPQESPPESDQVSLLPSGYLGAAAISMLGMQSAEPGRIPFVRPMRRAFSSLIANPGGNRSKTVSGESSNRTSILTLGRYISLHSCRFSFNPEISIESDCLSTAVPHQSRL